MQNASILITPWQNPEQRALYTVANNGCQCSHDKFNLFAGHGTIVEVNYW